MRRQHLRSVIVACLLVAGALALVLGVAFGAGPGDAAANGSTSPFANVDNVILFIGDGMGPNHLEVGRQLSALSDTTFNIDHIAWGGTGTLDTTSLDGITDSAAAGTALATGQETWNGWVSMGPGASGSETFFETALERAEGWPWTNGEKPDNAKAVGLVTDVELSDATPAVFTAHVPDRDLGEEITGQMASHDIDFLASGGWSESSVLFDPAYRQPDVTVRSLSDLNPYLAGTKTWPNKMYGIFGKTTLAYTIDREEEGAVKKQPTLPQLTQAAIGVLSKDPDGFFVMIEGGANDWGGHSRDAAWCAAEIRELDQAVKWAYDWAQTHGQGRTLIILEADHETGGLIVGPSTKYSLIAKQKASTEWMWGLIKAGKMSIARTLSTYAGFTPDAGEQALIAKNKEMGISDVLAARFGVQWGWSGTDEGDHTDTKVPVMAWGPGSGSFAIPGSANEVSGQQLLDAVSH
jgi:alkaline phosphatase